MIKLNFSFKFENGKEYATNFNKLFEEHPELKNKSCFYQRLMEHNTTIDALAVGLEKQVKEHNENEGFYISVVLCSQPIVTTQSKKTLKTLFDFVTKYKLERNYELRDINSDRYCFEDFV